jgi:hypothetical protein
MGFRFRQSIRLALERLPSRHVTGQIVGLLALVVIALKACSGGLG